MSGTRYGVVEPASPWKFRGKGRPKRISASRVELKNPKGGKYGEGLAEASGGKNSCKWPTPPCRRDMFPFRRATTPTHPREGRKQGGGRRLKGPASMRGASGITQRREVS